MQDINNLIQTIANIESISSLEKIRSELLGKSGVITLKFKILADLSPEARISKGQEINSIKNLAETLLSKKKEELLELELTKSLMAESIDITLTPNKIAKGSISPISKVTEEMLHIFSKYNFTLSEGPSIETDWYNFAALNIDENHPARDMHDTFYLNNSLLRTHTSPVQIRHMEKNKPPFRFIAPGRVYRADYDATHTPMFHQIEGVVVDKDINFSQLKWFLMDFIKSFFENTDVDIIFRPSFFPFTKPSAEVDIKIKDFAYPLEVLGCGMIHPIILQNVGINPEEYQGFAFGLGVERFAMLKYGINDLRKFFEGDMRWMAHYNFSGFDLSNLVEGLSR